MPTNACFHLLVPYRMTKLRERGRYCFLWILLDLVFYGGLDEEYAQKFNHL